MIPAVFTGYLGKDAESQQLKDGRTVARLRIGCNDSYRDANGDWQQAETYWLWAEAWGHLAENLVDLTKGTPVLIYGSWRERKYENAEGESRTARYVVMEAAGINLAVTTSAHQVEAETSPEHEDAPVEDEKSETSGVEATQDEGVNPL